MTTDKKLLQDKVSVVTGGGSSIGKAFAHSFAAEGSTVVVVDINDVTAKTVANDIGPSGEVDVFRSISM
jgi:NAD(P)-dependent dehydrogenase (short-subunit alcohol dehydrogenase family)